MAWPWNLGHRSLKVIQTGTTRKLGYGFLFAFHSNYGSILYYIRDKARYWSTPSLGGSRLNIAITFGMQKLERCGYPMVWKVWGFDKIPACDRRTDGWTELSDIDCGCQINCKAMSFSIFSVVLLLFCCTSDTSNQISATTIFAHLSNTLQPISQRIVWTSVRYIVD